MTKVITYRINRLLENEHPTEGSENPSSGMRFQLHCPQPKATCPGSGRRQCLAQILDQVVDMFNPHG